MRRGRSGFTVVEALIGLAVGLAVLGLLMGLLSIVMTTSARSDDRLEPREACRRTFAALRSELCDVSEYSIEAEGLAISFATPHGDGRAAFDPATGELWLRTADRRQVLARRVRSAVFQELAPGIVAVRLQIAREARGAKLAALDDLTAGDAFVAPAMLERDPALPWRDAITP